MQENPNSMTSREPLQRLIANTPPRLQHFLRKDFDYRQNTTYFPLTKPYLLTKARFNVYDSGDKAGKLLAQQARQSQSSRLIPKMYSQTGETITPSNISTLIYIALNVRITIHGSTPFLITFTFLLFLQNKIPYWEVRSPRQRF